MLDYTSDVSFRPGKPDDVEPLLRKYGVDHFTEGGFDTFSDFDLDRALVEMRKSVARDDTPFIVAENGWGEPVGWISWTMMHVFTVKPIAVLWTIYVRPEYRYGSIGRMLVYHATHLAKAEGACAFFFTVAPTSPAAQALCRILRDFGFADMGGAFSRKL